MSRKTTHVFAAGRREFQFVPKCFAVGRLAAVCDGPCRRGAGGFDRLVFDPGPSAGAGERGLDDFWRVGGHPGPRQVQTGGRPFRGKTDALKTEG